MARKKSEGNKLNVGNITGVTGVVNISGGDLGYTAEQVSNLLAQITTTFEPKKFSGRCPYKGLDIFEESDSELFFGRERVVEDLVTRVKESQVVFITGPSGSGKSSLVRAGLIPVLQQGAIPGSNKWLYGILKPGRDPIAELARAASQLAHSASAEKEIRNEALDDPTIFSRWCEIALGSGDEKRVVLFIDQFEEIFTQKTISETDRQAFLNLLTCAGTANSGRVILLLALRSDFISNCATYPDLNALLNRQLIQIGAMQPHELVGAIALPALHVGLRIDPDLIAQIINDMKNEPGALPLMQFALKDLFDAHHEKDGIHALTLEDYLQQGGIYKALERHADQSFAELNENEQQLARSIFSSLVEIGHNTLDTRRTALFDDIAPGNAKPEDVRATVHKLADARLITTDEQVGKDTITLLHEKLIEAWPWLRKLIDENREGIALYNEITNDANEWEEHKRESSYLYAGARLANAQEKLEANKIILNGIPRSFIEAGIKARVDELDAAHQRAAQLRRRSVYLTAALVVALIAGGIAVFLGTKARQQVNISLARQFAAQAQSIMASQGSKQNVAVMLAVLSMQIYPTLESAQVIQANILADPVVSLPHGDIVDTVVFSPDGRYVITGSFDNTARVWDATTSREVARMTHAGPVSTVAFSPDGRYVVSGSLDDTAQVWQAATGQEVARMIHKGPVRSVKFSPDGRYVVSGSDDGMVWVWQATTGKQVARMTHEVYVYTLAFSPDGRYVVSGSEDNTARVWEVTTGREVAHMIHSGPVRSVKFSPDGKYIVSGSDDSKVRVWQVTTGKEVACMTHDGAVSSVAFSPDGRYVVSGSDDNTARVWEVTTGREVARLAHDGFVSSVAFSPNGRYVVSGSLDDTARVWQAATGRVAAYIIHDGPVRSVAFSPDGRYVVSGSGDKTARVWVAAIDQEVAYMVHKGPVPTVAFSPDGRYVVSGSFDNTARVWDATAGREVTRMIHEGVVSSVAFSPDGRYVVSGSADGTVRVWQATTGREVARMPHDGPVSSVAFSPDGRHVVSGSGDKTARVWEAATGRETARLAHDDFVSSVAFSPDGRYVVSGSGDGTVRVWVATTGQEVARMTHDAPVWTVAFSPNSRYVISGSGDKTARVWEAATGREIARLAHDDMVPSVAFSPDGRYAVSGSWDGTARVWDAATSREVARVTHDAPVYAVAFNPDGKYVASAGEDQTVRVWVAATGQEVTRLAHDGVVYAVTFSPDSRYVVSGSADTTIRVWLYRPEDLMEDACAHLIRNITHAEWDQYIGNALHYRAVCKNLLSEPDVTLTSTATP